MPLHIHPVVTAPTLCAVTPDLRVCVRYVGMTRAKARLFLECRKKGMVFEYSWGGEDEGGAGMLECDCSRFIDDIPRTIVRAIDKTASGGSGSGVTGAKNSAYGGGGSRSESFQRRGVYGCGGGGRGSGTTGGAPKYEVGSSGAERGALRRGRGGDTGPKPVRDPPIDLLTEISNTSASRESSARRSREGDAGGRHHSGYPGANGGARYDARSRARGGYGAGGGNPTR